MSSMKVQGKAIFQGDKAVLKPDQMPKKKAAKEPRIVRVKPLPDAHQLVEDVNNGRTACHSTRRPISVQYVQVMIRNIQMALNLRESQASWSVDAHERLLELLLKPKLKRGKTAAIVDDEVESNDPNNAANMLENNVPQCNLNEMEPIVAEVPSSAYARNNEKDDVTEDKVKKDEVNKDNMNKRGAIQDDMEEDIAKKVDVEKENKKEDDVQQGDGHEDRTRPPTMRRLRTWTMTTRWMPRTRSRQRTLRTRRTWRATTQWMPMTCSHRMPRSMT